MSVLYSTLASVDTGGSSVAFNDDQCLLIKQNKKRCARSTGLYLQRVDQSALSARPDSF